MQFPHKLQAEDRQKQVKGIGTGDSAADSQPITHGQAERGLHDEEKIRPRTHQGEKMRGSNQYKFHSILQC